VLAWTALPAIVDAQTEDVARPMYTVMPPHWDESVGPDATPLTTWNGSFIHKGITYTYNMVGTVPSTNTATTIQAYIIPIELVITKGTKTKTFDPQTVLSNGRTVVENTVVSPIFDATTTYTQGGVDVGTTQYIDAYQRANFWSLVKSSPDYHLLLGGPTVLPEQTLSPPPAQGKTGQPLGYKVALVDINWFNAQLDAIIKANAVLKPGTLPIFLIYNTYLTNQGCCIGGYHSALGKVAAPHSYVVFSYVGTAGGFAQDVSALSHEVGEWADDPLVNGGNNSPCGILEVGDPLENNPNYGAYPYTVNGFTYNLQDLVTLRYFGAPANTAVNHFFTFQGEQLSVCQKGS
jgi:hypothetical protein